jgi:hypothetical protein
MPTGWRQLLCALALALCSAASHAAGFEIRTAATHLVDDAYQLTARIDYGFTAEVLEALDNGVPLTLRIEVEVQRVRRWWANETVTRLEQRHQLTYHAFSDQYLLRNLNSNALTIHPTLGLALDALSTVEQFFLLPAEQVEAGEEYLVQLRTALDIEALPAPLRPVAYVTPAWRLSSAWYACSLTP